MSTENTQTLEARWTMFPSQVVGASYIMCDGKRILDYPFANAYATALIDGHNAALRTALAKQEAQLEAFGKVAINVVPGDHGGGEEVPSTPESLKAHIAYLQEEWDGAERQLSEARAALAKQGEAIEAADKGLAVIDSVLAKHYFPQGAIRSHIEGIRAQIAALAIQPGAQEGEKRA